MANGTDGALLEGALPTDAAQAVIPDTGDHLRLQLAVLEDLLRELGGWGPDAWDPDDRGFEAAAEAVSNLGCDVHAAEVMEPPVLVGPGGQRLRPLYHVGMNPADLDLLGDAAQRLGRALLPGGLHRVVEGLRRFAGADRSAEDLVATAARLHGALSLPYDDDAEHLAGRLAGPDPIDLDAGELAGYHRLVERFDAIWPPAESVVPRPTESSSRRSAGPAGAHEHVVSIERRPTDHVALLGAYTEAAWVSLAGPTAVLVARRLARLAEVWPAGVDVDVAQLAASLGVAPGRLRAAIDRLATWGLIERRPDGLGVSGYAPLLPTHLLDRLPPSTISAHHYLSRRG